MISEDVFRKRMKDGISGGYLFFGEEDYLKSFALRSAREAICEDKSFEIFNDIRIDATDYNAPALLDALMPFPMMSDKKVVSVSGLYLDAMKPSEIDDLCDVLATLPEYDYNVLIISVSADGFDEGNLPKRPSALLTRLSKYLTPVRFEKVSPSRLVGWAGKHFAHNGVRADADVCSYLIGYSGSSMFTLSSEIDKLSFYALQHGRDTVTREDVNNVAIAEISTDTYALANSILEGKNEKALDALAVMKFNRVEPVMILSEVSKVICDLAAVRSMAQRGSSSAEIAAALKMNEYRVKMYMNGSAGKSPARIKKALSLCAEADAAIKLSPQGYQAIERLICAL